MSEHTTTPWTADPDWREGLSWNIHIVDAANRDMRICFMTSDGPAQANAAFIVKAVNAHDKLVEALQAIAGWRTVNLSAEYEHGLRDVIRSVVDCAVAALDTIQDRA